MVRFALSSSFFFLSKIWVRVHKTWNIYLLTDEIKDGAVKNIDLEKTLMFKAVKHEHIYRET